MTKSSGCTAGWVLAIGVVASATPAFAQGNLRTQMASLFTRDIVLARTPAGGGLVAHTAVFAEDPTVRETTDLINQVNSQIGLQLANVPIATSAGGFTYSFDPALGTFSRTTETYGPAYAERAVTTGRGRFALGLNYLYSSYSALDGYDLQDGAIRFNLFHQELAPRSFVEGDVVEAALRMRLKSHTTAFQARYGVTNNFDVGVAIPYVRVNMDLAYRATIRDFATRVTSPTTHLFPNNQKTQDFSTSGDAAGLGDVVLRTRYSFARRGTTGAALGIDLRMPTGDEDNMLGAGATQTKAFFIASSGGRFSPHVNVGYTVSSGSNSVPDEVNYVGGIEYGVNSRVTMNADFFGYRSGDALRLENRTVSHQFQQSQTAPLERTTLMSVALTPGSLLTAQVVVGAKINVFSTLLLSAHLLAPVSDGGLRRRPSLVLGFDHTF